MFFNFQNRQILPEVLSNPFLYIQYHLLDGIHTLNTPGKLIIKDIFKGEIIPLLIMADICCFS